MRKISVQEQAFDVGAEHQALQELSKEVGAVAVFVGSVRDVNDGDEVQRLNIESYAGMTEREIDAIVTEAEQRWSLIGVTVVHRVGSLGPGDMIVFVGVASQHRGDAFAACEFVMDYLKTRAPFWKKEQSAGGERWLTTRQSDLDAANRWNPSR